jgi:twinkle protein
VKWTKTHVACPCGQSSDAFSYREDGSGYCFSAACKNPNILSNNKKERDYEDLSDEYIPKFYSHRGISEKTFRKFNIMTKFAKDTEGEHKIPHSVGFPYPNGSFKVRLLDKKEFFSSGPMSQATLFLKNFFDPGSRRVITIVEGEYDALTATEILGPDSAVVSVRSASSAVQDCKNEWDYINSFEKIVVNLDNDEPGQTAAKKVLQLFDFKKTYNLVLTKHKDVNSYVWDTKTNQPVDDAKDYFQAWKGVKRHTPDNIISGNSSFRAALRQEREAMLATYPLPELQSKLFGIHAGEVIIIKALEKIGKTELFRLFEDHIFKTTKHPVGVIHLEEDSATTLKGMAAYYSQQPIHIPDSNASEDDIMSILEEINGPDEERIFLRSSFDIEDEDAFINGVRFLASVGGCRIIFLDHISWLATGGDDQDERKKLDRIATRLKLLAKELGFALIMISHVNDNGQTRGSRYITKVCDTIININRDKVHPDEVERSKTYIEIEGARLMGATSGPAGYAIYDYDTHILTSPQKAA